MKTNLPKKIFSFMLALILCVDVIPFHSMAAKGEPEEEWYQSADTAESGLKQPARGTLASPSNLASPSDLTGQKPEAGATDGSPAPGPQEPFDQRILEDVPYYLLLVHTLDIDGVQYGCSEVIGLDLEDFQDGSYDLRQHVLKKEGMEAVQASVLDPETGDLEAGWTVSLDDFTGAGDSGDEEEGEDGEDGSAYYALQALMEYRALDGYQAVLSGESDPTEDPYGIMPLTSFEGGNIKDITFVPADVVTVNLQFLYSPTGGLAGMDAAESRVYQMKVPDVRRDQAGQVIGVGGGINQTWDLPYCGGSDQNDYPALENFRVVLDPRPLNEFLVDPDRAEEAMNGDLSEAEIQEALQDGSFTVDVDTNDPEKYVYQWQVEGDTPPVVYEDYPQNQTYGNRYSDRYNQAWEQARTLEEDGFSARAVSNPARQNQGANPLTMPELTVSLTEEQCIRCLNSAEKEISVTVYYRRNAGFYHVAHWVPKANLQAIEQETYRADYPQYNSLDPDPDSPGAEGFMMVYLERKQGRIGAMTSAQANPSGAAVPAVLDKFIASGFSQEEIGEDTCVNILYTTTEQYSLIFNTSMTYIPRQHVETANQVIFDGKAGTMTIIRDGETCPVTEYHTPVRRGYAFLGWKYQVRSAADGDPSLTETENGQERYFQAVPYDGSNWLVDDALVSKAVIELTEETGEGLKVLNLYPVWNPSMASVRVVFWTEDLSGGNQDVCVEVNPSDKGGAAYRDRVADYLDTQPRVVGEHFSNAGSFTFLAEPNAVLDLQVTAEHKFRTSVTRDFQVLDPDSTAPEIRLPLPTLMETMFTEKMPDAETSMTSVDGTKIKTSRFFYPYKTDKAEYEVQPDGSTVIHVYYARKVYELDFTYYGEITGTGGGTDGLNSGTSHTGPGGLVVATNTIGYSKSKDPENFKYDYQLDDGNMPNRWQLVKDQDNPVWQVPEKIKISAKYDADLRNVWPMSNGETMELTLTEQGDLDKYLGKATFVSWGTTAGSFNEKYRRDGKESTLMGLYRSMGADIIADPDQEKTPHHLVAYWWNQFLSSYRRNACYEVPGLTRAGLVDQKGKSKYEKVIEYNIRVNREVKKDDKISTDTFKIDDMDVTDEEATRRNTLYLVPLNHEELGKYFEDYRSNFMRVDENGEPAEDGKYYALRCIGLADGSRVYALGRQAFSVSSNRINAQAPSTLPHMTVAEISYEVNDGGWQDVTVNVDHDIQAWDNWGQTAESYDGQTALLGLGTPEKPYDIWFYYDRARLTIHYMMPAKDSKSGEYELGTAEMIYGQSMKGFNVQLESSDKNFYSDHFASQWKPSNDNLALSSQDGRDLKDGYSRVCPDSAVDGTGIWTFLGWTLDRSSGTLLTDADWNKTATGHMRVYGKWDPPAYQVRFDFNGGQYQDVDTFPVQDVPANTSYTNSGNAIPQPVKPGYVLEGWEWYRGIRDAGGTLVPGGKMDGFQFETPFTQDMYVRAIWKSTEKETYNYKIWYLTDEPGAEPCEKPSGVSGEWLDRTAWGSLMPDPNPPAGIDAARFTRILGCEYYGNQEYARQVALAARPVSGYMPVKTSGFLTLDAGRNGTNPGNTRNVAYFYYRRNPDKTYQIRFQLYDRTGEEGILHSFTTQKVIADGTYFTPSQETSQALKESGYQLVQMNADGSVVMGSDGQPLAARTYQELEAFIRAENDRFAGLGRGSEAVVTFKVMPIFYTIGYQVGTLTGGDGTAVRDAMQEALDRLCGTMVKEAVDAGRNPTVYQVCDFDGGYSFTLTNPAAIRNPENGDRWIFTGWSPAPGTRVRTTGRTVEGEYPTLEIERSVGDLEFLANWELEGAPDDPDNPDKPDNPNTPDHPHRPGSSGDSSGGSSGGSSGSPSGTPSGTPGTPAPTTPSETPQMPPAGQEELPQLPDPNVPGAPDVVTVVEGSMSRTYRKFWDPELEEWIYLLDGEIPLDYLELPKTGDTRNGFWLWFNLLSLSGLGIFSSLAADRKKKGKDSGNHR